MTLLLATVVAPRWLQRLITAAEANGGESDDDRLPDLQADRQ
jgi:hypothetical protein